MFVLYYIVGVLLFQTNLGVGTTYRAGVVDHTNFKIIKNDVDFNRNLQKHLKIIEKYAKQDVDILMFPSYTLDYVSDGKHRTLDFDKILLFVSEIGSVPCETDSHSQAIKFLSCAAKGARMYVVVNVAEKKYCDNELAIYKTNLVFDRNGRIISKYSTPLNGGNSCNVTSADTFETDFGVTFGQMTYSDLFLRNPEYLQKQGVKNFILSIHNEYSLPSPMNFPSSWAYANKANLLVSEENSNFSNIGVYATNNVKTIVSNEEILIVDIEKTSSDKHTSSIVTDSMKSVLSVDLDLYRTVIFLDSRTSDKGYRETICHNEFCCNFFVKTSGISDRKLLLSVFNGHKLIKDMSIGLKYCGLIYCTEILENKCILRSSSQDDAGLLFEDIKISANFSNNSIQFPAIITDLSSIKNNQFNFDISNIKNSRHVSVRLSEKRNDILAFGLMSRDFSEDNLEAVNNLNKSEILYYYLFNRDDILGFFDYIWIRVRIFVIIVSIYFLEMM